ncbi:hypothetical protein PR002_g16479, partial [Phytophthora rubi]
TGVVYGVKGSLKPALLNTLCDYVLKKHKDDVTEAELVSLIQLKCRSLKGAFAPDVKALFKARLHMDLRIDDPEARVLKYFQDFNTIVEEEGLHGLIGRADSTDPER